MINDVSMINTVKFKMLVQIREYFFFNFKPVCIQFKLTFKLSRYQSFKVHQF